MWPEIILTCDGIKARGCETWKTKYRRVNIFRNKYVFFGYFLYIACYLGKFNLVNYTVNSAYLSYQKCIVIICNVKCEFFSRQNVWYISMNTFLKIHSRTIHKYTVAKCRKDLWIISKLYLKKTIYYIKYIDTNSYTIDRRIKNWLLFNRLS